MDAKKCRFEVWKTDALGLPSEKLHESDDVQDVLDARRKYEQDYRVIIWDNQGS